MSSSGLPIGLGPEGSLVSPFSRPTLRLSLLSKRSVPEKSMVSCFKVVPTDPKQALDRTGNREKTLTLP